MGLHPSLTNLQWRTELITKAINTKATAVPIHLYPRKLQEDTTANSAIVLRVPKKYAREVVTRFAQLQPGALGKQVEFVPYSLIQHTTNNSFRPLFSVQNQYIANVGAISIQGLPLAVMETPYGNKHLKPFHQWLLESKYPKCGTLQHTWQNQMVDSHQQNNATTTQQALEHYSKRHYD